MARGENSDTKWSIRNVATLEVYRAMIDRQFPIWTPFEDVGAKKLKSWIYWTGSSSANVRKKRAVSLAHWLGGFFMNIVRAKLEAGASEADAIKAMTKVLQNGDNTVGHLTKVIDDNYKFTREKH